MTMKKFCVFAFALALISAGCVDDPSPERHAADRPAPIDTSGVPQVINQQELEALGFDRPTLRELEDELFPLNTALIELAALKRAYDHTTDKEERGRLNVAAMPYHITADRYQRAVLLTLESPLDSIFDAYLEGRKRAVGLQDWHPDHREQRPPGEVPGLVPPRGRRH